VCVREAERFALSLLRVEPRGEGAGVVVVDIPAQLVRHHGLARLGTIAVGGAVVGAGLIALAHVQWIATVLRPLAD